MSVQPARKTTPFKLAARRAGGPAQSRPAGSPIDVGPIHFVGIGGIGMSGIAEVMLNLGYDIQGSDIKENPSVERLRGLGARVFIGHDAAHVAGAGAVVVSSAIKAGNPEVDAARAAAIPVVRRADMLAELMRLKWTVAIGGTHGKTTTTSMVAAILDAGGFDPTVINGGIINAYGANSKMGAGDWMVVEADESDGSFLKLKPTVAVVTNIDPEHMEHYGSIARLHAAFDAFVENLPFYGFAACCLDHPQVQALVSRVEDRRIVTYGFNPQADVRALNLQATNGHQEFDVEAIGEDGRVEALGRFHLPMAGKHNVANALAAISVALELGVEPDAIRAGLAGFGGVKRRFTRVGSWNGAVIIDDYGHHPVEIAAVLEAARASASGRVLAVVQPHRYSRLRDLFEDFSRCFNDADMVLVADVYAAGEEPIEGFNGETLAKNLRLAGHKDPRYLGELGGLAEALRDAVQPGDYIVCLGAGDITRYAGELEARLGEA